jgi:hypothetical protein
VVTLRHAVPGTSNGKTEVFVSEEVFCAQKPPRGDRGRTPRKPSVRYVGQYETGRGLLEGFIVISTLSEHSIAVQVDQVGKRQERDSSRAIKADRRPTVAGLGRRRHTYNSMSTRYVSVLSVQHPHIRYLGGRAALRNTQKIN